MDQIKRSGKERRRQLGYVRDYGNIHHHNPPEQRRQYDRRGAVTAEQLAKFLVLLPSKLKYKRGDSLSDMTLRIRLEKAQSILRFIRGEK